METTLEVLATGKAGRGGHRQWPDALNHAQSEALFAGLDWRRVRSVETRVPEAIE